MAPTTSLRRPHVACAVAALAASALAPSTSGCLGSPAYVPEPPPPVVPEGAGLRALTTWPDRPDPSGGYFPEDISPNGALIAGEVGTRLHVVTAVLFATTLLRGDPEWRSIDETGATADTSPGRVWGDWIQVLDDESHFYAWEGGRLLRRQWIDSPEGSMVEEVAFDGVGPLASTDPGLSPGYHANRALDLAITSRYWNLRDPMLFVREGDGPGVSYLISYRELALDRDYAAGWGYAAASTLPEVFDPIDGAPFVVDVADYGGGRVRLQVFTTSEAQSEREPSARVLRRLDAVPVAAGAIAHVLATPRSARVLVTQSTSWSLYDLDRATGHLSLDWTMEAPFDFAGSDVVPPVVTDDGVLYVGLRLREAPSRFLRVVDGVASDLWPTDHALSDSFRFDALYTNGARVFALVSGTYAMTYAARGGVAATTLSRPRFTLLTPDVADVPPPAPVVARTFVPPATCNPVSGEGCGMGQACDAAPSLNGFSCFPAGTAALCEPCDPDGGPSCAPGHLCYAAEAGPGICLRACCTNDDCGVGGLCTPLRSDFVPGKLRVGICQSTASAVDFVPACTGVPAVAPSEGACSALP